MTKPKDDEKRAPLYLAATTAGYAAGTYVGETREHVVLNMGQGGVRGFPWRDVEPVTMKETSGG